jgi:hypothetical protein
MMWTQYKLLSMSVDIVDLAKFYASPLGLYVQGNLAQSIGDIWSPPHDDVLLGYGYGAPLFADVWPDAEWQFLMPAQTGVMVEHEGLAGHVTLVEESGLPLRDDSVNRFVGMHALETARHIETLLDEVWRVVVPNGRVLLVVPNRRGLWARGDATPFGSGRPFSRSQLRVHLIDAGFDILRLQPALMLPPFVPIAVMQKLSGLDRALQLLVPQLGGVWLVEAVKKVPAPLKKKRRFGLAAGGWVRPVFSQNLPRR